VVRRRVPYTELGEFSEVLGTGTAVGLISIGSITRRKSGKPVLYSESGLLQGVDSVDTFTYTLCEDRSAGYVYQRLSARLMNIQVGKVGDDFGWRTEVREEDQRA
jgi:branched-chain amino acid aminotransferase